MFSTSVTKVTLATCCHNMERKARIVAKTESSVARLDRPLEGKGLTSLSEPLSSISSDRPGKDMRMPVTTTNNAIAASLRQISTVNPHLREWSRSEANSH